MDDSHDGGPVPGRLLHDLRRTVVRALDRAGVPRPVAKALIGHKSDAVHERYNIVSERDHTDGVARYAAYLGGERSVLRLQCPRPPIGAA